MRTYSPERHGFAHGQGGRRGAGVGLTEIRGVGAHSARTGNGVCGCGGEGGERGREGRDEARLNAVHASAARPTGAYAARLDLGACGEGLSRRSAGLERVRMWAMAWIKDGGVGTYGWMHNDAGMRETKMRGCEGMMCGACVRACVRTDQGQDCVYLDDGWRGEWSGT